MKTVLIILPQPVLVSDEEIKEGDWCVYQGGNIIQYLVKLNTDNLQKIIAGIPELPTLINCLSEEHQKRTEWFNVERICEGYFKDNNIQGPFPFDTSRFEMGFKAHQALTEKKYSEEDVMKAMDLYLGYDVKHETDAEVKSKIIQSLSQPKMFDVITKRENNSIKVLKVL